METNADADPDTDSDADARVTTIALPKLYSGKLNTDRYITELIQKS